MKSCIQYFVCYSSLLRWPDAYSVRDSSRYTCSTSICLFCLCYVSLSICWHTNMSFIYVGQHNIHLPDVHEEVSHKINNKENSEQMSSSMLPFFIFPNQISSPQVPGSLLCLIQSTVSFVCNNMINMDIGQCKIFKNEISWRTVFYLKKGFNGLSWVLNGSGRNYLQWSGNNWKWFC
jgi:hypothetical protein